LTEQFVPADEGFKERVRASFERQTFMKTIGATLERVEPGYCEIHLPFREDLCQQHGFMHAGVTGTIADNAAGYAAYTLMPADSSVLSVEFKLNLLRPAAGEKLISRARVKRAGRSITVVEAEVSALADGEEKPVAAMLATMMCMQGTPDEPTG
jgi:uncharacterized protein (TIGR00369 family)